MASSLLVSQSLLFARGDTAMSAGGLHSRLCHAFVVSSKINCTGQSSLSSSVQLSSDEIR